jgi:hypothetical protein
MAGDRVRRDASLLPTGPSQTAVPITREIVHYLEPDLYAVRRNNGRSGSRKGRGMKIAPGIAVKSNFLDAVYPAIHR